MPNPTGVLLLHGYGGHRNSNWLKWLRNELRSHDVPVFAPDLPTSDYPILADHLDTINPTFAKMGERPVIVAHSLGAVAAMHAIGENDLTIGRLVLVAPVARNVASRQNDWTPPPEFFSYRDAPFPYAGIVNARLEGATILLSRTDPYIDFEPTLAYYRDLFGEKLALREYPDAGHFNVAAGYREFPDLIDEIFH